MRHLSDRKIVLFLAGGMLLVTGWLLGQQTATTQPTLMHAFAYTPVETATPQDFENLKKATADMVGKVPGLRRVWVGKLKTPFDAPEGKRLYGMAMEFDDEKALAVYAEHPAHAAWERVYRRVRVPGTTTFDILGE
jgi:hypothetical protein